MRGLALGLLALSAAACEKESPTPPPVPLIAPVPALSAPADEPQRLTVKHILIGVKGGQLPSAKLGMSEAENLALDLLGRARSGEDFDQLVSKYSEDPGKTPYTLTNHGVAPAPGEFARATMVSGFGDVSFRLQVGQVGIAPYDPKTSVFGYHVIKRVN